MGRESKCPTYPTTPNNDIINNMTDVDSSCTVIHTCRARQKPRHDKEKTDPKPGPFKKKIDTYKVSISVLAFLVPPHHNGAMTCYEHHGTSQIRMKI